MSSLILTQRSISVLNLLAFYVHVIAKCDILIVFVDRVQSLPSISALKFNGSLAMAVGTSTGQVSRVNIGPMIIIIVFVNHSDFKVELSLNTPCHRIE